MPGALDVATDARALAEWLLAGAPEAAALHDHQGTLTRGALLEAAEGIAADLGTARGLVLVRGTTSRGAVAGLLGAWLGGHAVLLVPPGRHEPEWRRTWRPDAVVGDGLVERLEPAAGHELHPELALLLPTSGSTGSPKLVRLPAASVAANARQIATALPMRADDRALLSLPLAYSYGLSVLTSNLALGASIVLADGSPVDPCTWALAEQHAATSLHLVPHGFEMLRRSGRAWARLPSLRYVTCAGGALDRQASIDVARLGDRHGWGLWSMYGQTEATARMAVLPAAMAIEHAGELGQPVDGGAFAIEPVPETDGDPDAGELVFTGPNVMLGYAQQPADLALGRTVTSLRTGDLARMDGHGHLRIIGRRSRMAKVLGHRIDLDRLECLLADQGIAAMCVEHGGCLGVVAERSLRGDAAAAAADATGLPASCIVAAEVERLPRSASGKADRAAAALAIVSPTKGTPSARRDLATVYAEVLGRPASPDGTFVSLGGDSLSYVELSTALEDVLGTIPPDWHVRTIAELEALRRTPGRTARIETSVLLRALAIVAIVGSHAQWFNVRGGAHVLLAVVGFGLARFHLADVPRTERVRRIARGTARIALPSIAVIAVLAWLSPMFDYGPANIALLNFALGDDTQSPQWHFWFIESLTWSLVAVLGLAALRPFDTVERRWPFATAIGALGVALAIRELPLGPESMRIYAPAFALWCVALGWAVARSRTGWQRALVVAIAAAASVGVFENGWRAVVLVAGVAALAFVPSVRLPRAAVPVVAAVAASSLAIYLLHFQVFPHLMGSSPMLATAVSIAVGVLAWRGCRAASALRRWRMPA